ncbi:MAG: riboflavin synthase [Planctomycetota bacterium]
MFTGIVQAIGRVERVESRGRALKLAVDVSGLPRLPAEGGSISVDGACLTVASLKGTIALFDVVEETVSRSTLGALRPGARVNLEGALAAGDPLDGHVVLGHVDGVGELLSARVLTASRVCRFSMPPEMAPLVAEKGSIAVNGVSLTVTEAGREGFSVSLIPETDKRTNLGSLQNGAKVNLEADLFARYAARLCAFASSDSSAPLSSPGLSTLSASDRTTLPPSGLKPLSSPGLMEKKLREHGYL